MNIEQLAHRYYEIHQSFDGQTNLIDLEIEVINMLADELFYNGDMDEMKKTLVSMYYLGKINQQHNGKNN
jgi:hypothetical protein